MVAREFCLRVNNKRLPSSNFSPNLPRSISVRIATTWLRRLGFQPTSQKKGAYVDGHERDDVVAQRKQFLDELKSLRELHLPPPPPCDERVTTPPSDAETRKRLELTHHDESILHTNEGQKRAWATGEEPLSNARLKVQG